MRRTVLPLTLVLFGLSSFWACDDDEGPLAPDSGDEPVTEVRPGIIQQRVDGPVDVTVPTEATVGETVSIRVRSFGNGCVRGGETSASVNGLSAVVLPLDTVRVGVACTEQLLFFDHTTDLVFSRAGTASVAIVGRRWPDEQVVITQRAIEVR